MQDASSDCSKTESIMPHIASLSGFHFAAPTLAQRLGDAVRTWQTRARERHQLAKFTAFDLKDIGMTEADRSMQLAAPFWRD
jgi:uncharacterized protein YjiS (DUF1127 family)